MKFYYKILAVLMLLAVIALKWMDVDFGSNKGTQVKSITTSVEEVVAEYPDLPNAIEIANNDVYMSELEDLKNIREGKTPGTPVPMMTEIDDLRNIQAESGKRKLEHQKAIQKKQAVSNTTSKQVESDAIKQVDNQSNEHNEVIADKNETTSVDEGDTDTLNDESVEVIAEEKKDKNITISSDIIEENSSTGFYIDEDGNVVEFDYED